tara:strand:+ start:849 stop:1418 length:570 start_codon:yes stop_codon:yes gene_type:complete
MPKSTKLVIVNSDGVCCEKCDTLVPEKYYLGQNKKDDELWIECIHTGWYCPNHSPTNNCDDDECPCCNAGYEEDEWFIDFCCGEESEYYDTKEEMKEKFDLYVKDLREFGCITIDATIKRPTSLACYGDEEAEDWMWADDDEDEEEEKSKSEVEFDTNAMDNALYKDNLDWSFYKPEEGEYSVIYISRK